MSGVDVSFGDWLAALRSGDYKQGRGALRRRTGFCCIGVAADLVDPDGWSSGWWWRQGATEKVKEHIPWMTVDVEALGVGLNDHQRLSFPEIADRMEAKFPELLASPVGGDDA